MDREEAKELLDGLTYREKLLLRELLLGLQQSQPREQSLEGTDPEED